MKSRQKGKKKGSSKERVFGCDLQEHLHHSGQEGKEASPELLLGGGEAQGFSSLVDLEGTEAVFPGAHGEGAEARGHPQEADAQTGQEMWLGEGGRRALPWDRLGMRMRTLERRGWKGWEPRRGRRSRGEKMTAGDRVRKCATEEHGQSLGQNERSP